MKSLLSIGLVLIWSSLLTAYSLKDNRALGNGNVGPRIVGGRDAKPHEFPYIVSLTLHTPDGVIDHKCGGSVLNERWILTSAHCFDKMEGGFYEIRGGAHFLNETMKGEQTSLVSRTIIHPGYNQEDFATNDIALVELETPFTFSETVQPIALPPQDEIPLEGLGIASGWGAIFLRIINGEQLPTYTNTLQTMTVPVITNAGCHAQNLSPEIVNEHTLCTFEVGKGVCFGDSGGPLVQNNKVVGVTKLKVGDCQTYPSVYERVSFYTNWINSYFN